MVIENKSQDYEEPYFVKEHCFGESEPTYADRLKWWIEIGKPLLVDHGIYVEFENRSSIEEK